MFAIVCIDKNDHLINGLHKKNFIVRSADKVEACKVEERILQFH
jgi:hypothetical protein